MQLAQPTLPHIPPISVKVRLCPRPGCGCPVGAGRKWCSVACKQWGWRDSRRNAQRNENVTLLPQISPLEVVLNEALAKIQEVQSARDAAQWQKFEEFLKNLPAGGGGGGGGEPAFKRLHSGPANTDDLDLGEITKSSGDGRASSFNFSISMVGIGVAKIHELPTDCLLYAIQNKKLPVAECQAVLDKRAAAGKYSPVSKTEVTVTNGHENKLPGVGSDGNARQIQGANVEFAAPDFEELDLL